MTIPAPAAPENTSFFSSPFLWALFIALALSRLWGLDYQAFHHDESIHSLAIWKLARQGPAAYSYNPVYHGPLFYHLGAVFSASLPDTDFTARLPFAATGMLLVASCLPLAALLGRRAALLLAALLIISPTITYYSRFAREDVVMAAILAWVVVCGALYFKTRRTRWLTVAWVFMILGYCTKENSYINWFIVCAYLVFMGGWAVLRDRRRGLWLIAVEYLPLTRLLIIFGAFSFFMFLFVAIDVRIAPDTPLLNGLRQIAMHSVSLSNEAVAQSAKDVFLDEHGYFTDPGREGVRRAYQIIAVVTMVFMLVMAELLAARCRGLSRGLSLVLAGAAALGYGASGVWLWSFFHWAAVYSGSAFLTDLLRHLISGWLLLSGIAMMAMMGTTALRYRSRAIRLELRKVVRLWRSHLVSAWALVVQLILGIGIYCFLFSSLGSNAPNGLRAGLYDYIGYWFRQQTGEYRIWAEWWYYLPRLALYESASLILIGVCGAVLLLRRKPSVDPALRQMTIFAAWLTGAMFAAYALLNEKVGWLAMYQAYALALLAALIFMQWISGTKSRPAIGAVGTVAIAAMAFTCWQHALAVHLHPDSPTEPMAFVTTSRSYLREVKRVERAHWEAAAQGIEPPLVAMSGEGVWPAAWYLRRLRTTADSFAREVTIRILDDTAENRRRVESGSDYVWETRPALVRGWWFARGEGWPARENLLKNLYALAVNASNDHRGAFPPHQPVPDDYASRFMEQMGRFMLWRTPWFPATGTPVIFAWQTDVARDRSGDVVWLDGLFREAREAAVVERIGMTDKLSSPRAVAYLRDGTLAVADSGHGRVCIFTTEGALVRAIGDGVLSYEVTGPCGLAEGRDGQLYVTDTWHHALRLFSSTGELLATCDSLPAEWGRPNLFGPRGIAVAGEGDSRRIYAADTGNNRVVVLDAMLKPLMTWGQAGDRAGEFNEPVGIVVDSGGSVFVADTGNARIQQFNSDGAYIREFSVFAPEEHERLTVEPQLSLLPDGRRLAMTWATRGIFVIISPGTGEAWPWKPAGEAVEPSGIAISPEWDLYMTDRKAGVILRLLEAGESAP